MRTSALILIALVGGCSVNPISETHSSARLPFLVQKVLHRCSEFVLLSLGPETTALQSDSEKFLDWEIIDRVSVENNQSKEHLIDALASCAKNNYGWSSTSFNPRHGIHAVHNGEQHDLAVSFDCAQVRWYVNNELREVIYVSQDQDKSFDRFLKENNAKTAPVSTLGKRIEAQN